MRIAFMGTAALACPSLKALCRQKDFQVVAVVTQPDRPKGRELKPAPSPVKAGALDEGVPVLQPARAREEGFLAELRRFEPELIVVAAYGQILPQAILDLPRFGCLNVHASLLPRHRGAAPIQWAILEDDTETGVTIMKIDAGLDTGAVLTTAATPIAPADNAQTLHDRLAALGADLLVRTIPDYVAGRVTPRPQPAEGVTYARKITKEDGRVDWSLPARAIWNRVRAFTPWPGAFTGHGPASGTRLLKLWCAQVEPDRAGPPGEILQADKAGLVVGCGRQALRVLELQREGGRRLAVRDFLAGHPLVPGERLHGP
jgi:methionyl-tRNA formyltransferase